MQEENNTSQDIFECDLETLSSKPVVGTSKSSVLPLQPVTQKETSIPSSSIPPSQKNAS